MTAVSPEVRVLCLERAGYVCEFCYGPLDGPFGYSLQHRAARRAGGSKLAHLGQPPNLLVMCGSGVTQCHGKAEANPEWAYERGLALRTGWDPEQTPYQDIHDQWRLLLPDGQSIPIQMPWRRP